MYIRNKCFIYLFIYFNQESSACNPQNMETWLIDMQPCNEGIVFLMAAYCADASSFIEFALGND